MDDPAVNTAIETLAHSGDIQELQTALMDFSLRIDANACSQSLRERLWKALSTNAKFWKSFIDEKDPTLPQMAAHALSSFAGDEFLLRWPVVGEILPRLAARINDVPIKEVRAIESYAKDVLAVCLACSRVPHLSMPVASSILQVSKVLPRSSIASTPQYYEYICDCMRNLVQADRWYRDGTVRSVFTWLTNVGLTLFVNDQSATKFEFARLVGVVLMNAAPPSSAKHRIAVVDSFLPDALKVPLADSIRSVLLSRSMTASKRHVSAILVFNAGLQRWLCRDGELWLFSVSSKLFTTENEIEKLLPMLALYCSTEFVRIIAKPENDSEQKIDPADDQAIAASLQLMEDLLEFIVVRSEDDENSSEKSKSLSATVLLETHRCLREAAVSAIARLAGEDFEQPNSSGLYSEKGGLLLACFRWGCRFVAQDAATMEEDALATLVRYGTDGLVTPTLVTACLIPMFAAALANISSLDDSDKGKAAIRRCFLENGTPNMAKADCQTYLDQISYLVDGVWKQKAVEVDSTEGKELLDSLKQGIMKLKQKQT